MKILQINKYHYLKGGSETVYFNTTNLLESHGHSVVHFSMDDEKNQSSPTQQYFPKAFDLRDGNFIQKIKNAHRFFYNQEAKKKLEELIIRERPEIAQIHLFNNSFSVSIFPVLKKYNIPVILTLHDHRLLCPSSSFLLKGRLCETCKEKLYLNCAIHKCAQGSFINSLMLTFELWERNYFFHLEKYIDKYLFISRFQMNMHFSYDDFYKEKCKRLYNFIPDLKQIEPQFKRGDYFFFYGRITEEKGIRTLINVAASLKDVKFKIAGNGPLLEEMKTKAPSNVEFLGFQTGENLSNLIKNSSFIITPSEGIENSPMSILEGYTFGKPSIGSIIGGIPEIIIENETGFLFEVKSEAGLKQKIEYAHSLSDEDYLRLSKKSRNFAEENFDPELYYNQLLGIYEEVIEKKKSKKDIT